MHIENSIACIFPAVLFIANTVVLLSGLKPASESYYLHMQLCWINMPSSAASMESKTNPIETVTWMSANYVQRLISLHPPISLINTPVMEPSALSTLFTSPVAVE